MLKRPKRQRTEIARGLDPSPVTRLSRLSALWRAFERSGAVSAYIAYRLHLSRVIRDMSWPDDGPGRSSLSGL